MRTKMRMMTRTKMRRMRRLKTMNPPDEVAEKDKPKRVILILIHQREKVAGGAMLSSNHQSAKTNRSPFLAREQVLNFFDSASAGATVITRNNLDKGGNRSCHRTRSNEFRDNFSVLRHEWLRHFHGFVSRSFHCYEG